MEALFTDDVLRRSPSMVARVVAGETMIVPASAKVGDLATIYTFNGTGAWIWEMLESPRTVGELASLLASEYEVDAARAERDVMDFVGEMKGAGLVFSSPVEGQVEHLVEPSASVAMTGD